MGMGTGPLISFDTRWPGRSLIEHAALSPSSIGDTTPPAPGVAIGVEIAARVNSGRWIADCPADGCSGAEYVNLDAPLFFCCECRNSMYDHHPIQVTIPDVEERARIEALLTVRPMRANQHWDPGETLQELQAENLEHEIVTP